MHVSDFDFELPAELIAQFPSVRRSEARLLQVGTDGLRDRTVGELPALLHPGDLLVVNDTRVIRARLLGQKVGSGGRIEVLVERLTDTHQALVQLRASKSPRPGVRLAFGDDRATVTGRDGEFFLLHFDAPSAEVLERQGRTPLPPYITHAPEPADEARYQTVYARAPGAVAAPTAGLHFDEALFAALAERGVGRASVTLHVGAGTFQPVRVDDLSRHVMHAERWSLPQATADAIARTRAAGGRIVAVGTTTLRALESAALEAEAAGRPLAGASGDTRLFVTPGFRFRVVDVLVTNFHLPRSTLLMLVSAFAGTTRIREAYAHAIAERYRFFSYGDAMLLERAEPV
jgi:S-adenosylmethionine:tRNA ribosyltransferase-isomerase